tara:strand:+ start:211 stop:804 length:594 start_codon:yes stop_codon:yes gene_type:complete
MSESNKPINQQTNNAYERPVARIFDFYLSGEIKEARDYQDWTQIMRTATENDAIVIHINSPGGEMFSAIQIMRAMAESPATIIASVEGMCMSAATLIFLSAEVCEISDHSHFMFHTYSSGNWGKGHEQLEQTLADDKWARNLFTSVYKNFLTATEITDVVKGRDLWMDSKEVSKRLEARNKIVAKNSKRRKATKPKE